MPARVCGCLLPIPPKLMAPAKPLGGHFATATWASDVITRPGTLYSKNDPQSELMDLNEAARQVTSLSQSVLPRNRVIMRHEFAEDLPPVRGIESSFSRSS